MAPLDMATFETVNSGELFEVNSFTHGYIEVTLSACTLSLCHSYPSCNTFGEAQKYVSKNMALRKGGGEGTQHQK